MNEQPLISNTDHIQPGKQTLPAFDLLRGFSSLFPSEIIHAENLNLGLTNKNYKCLLANGETFVIRIAGEGTQFLVDRKSEYKILQRIVPLGIDVDHLYYSCESGTKITRYVDGCCYLGRSVPDFLLVGATVFRKLHHSGISFDVDFNFWKKLDSYLSCISQLKIGIAEDFFTQIEKLVAVEKRVASSIMLTPCHNDPVPENFLVEPNNKVRLIDWEYGGMNDPLWDLAAFSLEFDLMRPEETQLLKHYFQSNVESPDLERRMLINKVYQDFIWYLWSEIKIFFGQDLSQYASMRYTRGKQHLEILFKK